MFSYSTERKSYWPAIGKRMLYIAATLLIIAIAGRILLQEFNNNIYWLLSGGLLVAFADQINNEYIQNVQIDENNKTITYHYRSPLHGNGEKIHILSQVQMYVSTRSAAGGASPVIRSLSLYKQRRRVLALSNRMDGFAPATLEAIRHQLHQLGVTE